jgi:hypothetical protein
MESSTGGCNGKVCRNVYPLASLLARGYRPVRYRALEKELVAQVTFHDAQKADASKADPRKSAQAEPRKSVEAEDHPVHQHKSAQAEDHPVHRHKKHK